MKHLFINNIKYTLIKQFETTSGAKSYFAIRNMASVQQKVFLKSFPVHQETTSVYHSVLNLHCPHIPKIYEVYDDGNQFYIIQEWIEGLSLADVFDHVLGSQHKKNSSSFIDSLLLSWVYEISLAIESLQNCEPPVIHHDIAAHNIMIRKNDFSALLIDFDHSYHLGQVSKGFSNPIFSGSLDKTLDVDGLEVDILSLFNLTTALLNKIQDKDMTCLFPKEMDFKENKIVNAKNFRQKLESFLLDTKPSLMSRPELFKLRSESLDLPWPRLTPKEIPTKPAIVLPRGPLKLLVRVSFLIASLMSFIKPVGSFEEVPIHVFIEPWAEAGVKERGGEWVYSPESGRQFYWRLEPGEYLIDASHPVMGSKILKISVEPENPTFFILNFSNGKNEKK